MVGLLEADVEELIVTAVIGATPGMVCQGFWAPAPTGEVKERPRSHVGVMVMPREHQSWGQPFVTLHAAVTIFSDGAEDPDGAAILAAYKAVAGLFAGWQADESAAATALSISGTWDAHGVIFAAGGDSGFDDTRGAWYATIMLDIKGVLSAA